MKIVKTAISREGSFFANKVDMINTFIGIAVKDSSEAEVKKLNVTDSKICLSVYRKKQEFGPSKIHTQDFTCLGGSYNFIQEGSVLLMDEKRKEYKFKVTSLELSKFMDRFSQD